MKCPKCRQHEMNVETHKGVEIDRCPVCHGLFLDRGEPASLIRLQAANEVDSLSFTMMSDDLDLVEAECGRCEHVIMTPIEGPGGIRVDRCQHCGGIFLDQGELASIQLHLV